MKVLCVSLSPAIDVTLRLPAWPKDGDVLVSTSEICTPGGKGLNVARHLAARGAEVVCCGFLGEENASPFASAFARLGIDDRMTRVPGPTRTNAMITTPQGSFKVNRPAFPSLTREQAEAALAHVRAVVAQGAAVVILSGSLPPILPVETYRLLIDLARESGARTVLDTSGRALAEGVLAHPDVIKPNAVECAALVGKIPVTAEDFARVTAALRRTCGYPIISDGANGCWFDGRHVAAKPVEVVDTTGAGDALLAAWCWMKYACGASEEACAEEAVRAGSAACAI